MVEIKIYVKSKLESHGLRYEYYEKLTPMIFKRFGILMVDLNQILKNKKKKNIRPDGGIIMAILPTIY